VSDSQGPEPRLSSDAPIKVTPETREFFNTEAAAGGVLVAAAIVALIWANFGTSYFEVWDYQTGDGFLGLHWPHSPAAWVADLLMAVYFFVAGLEIKREVVAGELRTARLAALPIAGAIGGMLVPALVYAVNNPSGPGAEGWGIPMATDIAFALGLLALVARGAPPQVRVFLLSLAIVDDLGAIAVIAIFYTDQLHPLWFLVAALFGVVTWVGYHRLRSANYWLVVIGALGMWVALFQAGVHPTIAGVIAGIMAPAKEDARGHSEAEDLVHKVHPWSSFVIAPLFALSSAGVLISGNPLRSVIEDDVGRGVFLGLVVGKPVGILLGCYLAVRMKVAAKPTAYGWSYLAATGVLAGIGFTVALLINELAFGDVPELHEPAQIAILLGAVVASLISIPAFMYARHRRSLATSAT
jgi:NhaA family Na+:H+ antiporter